MSDNNQAVAFYNMMKKWIHRDYCTAGIKSEVIFDTILSEFVAKLVALKEQSINAEGTVKTDDYKLVLKEFPITREESQEDNTNAKIDYLVKGKVAGKDKYYIVELKTSNGSVNERQYDRYMNMGNNLFDCFASIIGNDFLNSKDMVGDKLDIKDTFVAFPKATKKYVGSLIQLNNSGLSRSEIKRICLGSEETESSEELADIEVEIVYLSLQAILTNEFRDKYIKNNYYPMFISFEDILNGYVAYTSERTGKRADELKYNGTDLSAENEIENYKKLVESHFDGDDEWESVCEIIKPLLCRDYKGYKDILNGTY